MSSIWLILVTITILYLFWVDRMAAENAREFAKQQCEKLQVQFLSIACKKKRLGILKNGKPGLRSEFAWEFSSTGQDIYTGLIMLENGQVVKVDIPPHKIN
jgi:hypothetical protein